LGGIQVGI
jgi:hypothetical protein